MGVVEAGHRADPSVARAYGAYRSRHRRRPKIFQQGKVGTAGRPAETAASAGAPDRHTASARRVYRRHRAAAAAHAAIVESAGVRDRQVRSDRERTGGITGRSLYRSTDFIFVREGARTVSSRPHGWSIVR